MTAVTLNLDSITTLTHEEFWELSLSNRDVRLELTEKGKLVVMPPTGEESGSRNANLTTDINLWNRKAKLGRVYDSSTGFRLPNGAVRSPDAAWVKQERLDTLEYDPEKFLPLAPDFVVELRSASDSVKDLRDKMKEYMENGVRLGWFLNPQDKTVEVYRTGNMIEVLRSPTSLSGEDVLPGFVLELQGILN
ncbi:MAG: Uma2 family endonuclease [Gloeobacterales cyanobacterium]